MADDSDLEKSEAPTAHRLEKAREEGQIPRSRELTSVLMLLAGLAILWMGGESLARQLAAMIAQGMRFDHGIISDDRQILFQIEALVKQTVWALLPVFAGLVMTALAAPLLLGGVMFNPGSIKFDLKKLNPLPGLKRVVSSQSLSELFKAILKALLVGWVTGWFLWHNWPLMVHLVLESPVTALGDALDLIATCMLLIIMSMIPIVAFDVFWQLWSHSKKLRMTRQEIRDEFKDQEGDPHVKNRIRQQQRALSKRRMMNDVPKADVIITNPTHYAVALRYEDSKMSAPKVIAKGAGEIALRIRELGESHRIPLLEAPPLARALYRHCDIGQSIPAALYAAVAEVLAWVYQLKRWRREGGLIPKTPTHLPVPTALDFVHEKE
ncbi:flagellar type III secretion system protein FlhB [Sodalis ligni]|jgi:flagellar biosynthetic protein FlhB|uniref:Flagellar biosynthetic protein FlhB n=1 Tax=Sodalis ligni TaxID=2697027 RepID=A0A4R1N6S9_9GAMM|nr:flagellar biosynthesis protein FlhB [Sodalis ligni]QWA09092.1 flagellar type III secretion system protein FlhB [Sodalis ligni]TCL02247.1 flagellar biosynthetic protein FlhB [Sodalis ligni]